MGMNFPVKWYDNSMGGISAPTTPATFKALLDAVLVTGFNTVTLDSVVISGNVATATRSAGNHGFAPYQVIEIAGATPSALNGQWRVIDVTPTTFTFATTGISDQTASGTITCKTPPLGWEHAFTSSGTVSVYRSPNVDHCARSFFRADFNDGNWGANFQPYELMTDNNTGTGMWRNPSASSGGTYLNLSADGRWFIVGDDKTVYGHWVDRTYPNYDANWAMGAFESYLPNDVWNDWYCGLGQGSNIANARGYNPFSLLSYASYGFNYNTAIRRRALGDTLCRGLPVRWVNDASGYGGPAYPEPFTNGLFVTPNLLRDVDYGGNPVRGRIRGTYWVLQNAPMYCPGPGINLDDVIGLEGRRCRLIQLRHCNSSPAACDGRALYDITGPWD